MFIEQLYSKFLRGLHNFLTDDDVIRVRLSLVSTSAHRNRLVRQSAIRAFWEQVYLELTLREHANAVTELMTAGGDVALYVAYVVRQFPQANYDLVVTSQRVLAGHYTHAELVRIFHLYAEDKTRFEKWGLRRLIRLTDDGKLLELMDDPATATQVAAAVMDIERPYWNLPYSDLRPSTFARASRLLHDFAGFQAKFERVLDAFWPTETDLDDLDEAGSELFRNAIAGAFGSEGAFAGLLRHESLLFRILLRDPDRQHLVAHAILEFGDDADPVLLYLAENVFEKDDSASTD